MRAAGCRLVDATSGEKPSVEQILLRLAGSFYSLIALGAGFLWVGLSPTKILERGYAIVSNETGILKDTSAAPAQSRIHVRLGRGELDATVQ